MRVVGHSVGPWGGPTIRGATRPLERLGGAVRVGHHSQTTAGGAALWGSGPLWSELFAPASLSGVGKQIGALGQVLKECRDNRVRVVVVKFGLQQPVGFADRFKNLVISDKC